jgi:hypothetical protein
MEFSYRINKLGECNLSSIKYTGHEEHNKEGLLIADRRSFATVDFVYEAAPRSMESFVAGHRFVRDQRLKSIISRVYEKPIDMNAGAGRIASRYELGVLQSEMPQTVFFLRRCINMARVMMDLRCNQQPSLILFLRSDGKSFPSSAVLADRERLGAAYRFAHFAPSGNLTDMLFATRVCFS